MKICTLIFIVSVIAACGHGGSTMSDNIPDYTPQKGKTTVCILQDGQWKEAWQHTALVSDFSNHSRIWNDWDNSLQLRDTMMIALFEDEFTSPVRVRIYTEEDFKTCEVRPSALNIDVDVLDCRSVEFMLPSFDARKVSVEFDGNRQENIFVVGNRKDTGKPTIGDADVLYFGPGIHDMGVVSLGDNKTVYVDFGAVLNANFKVTGDNVRFAGNGIITGRNMRHWGNDQYACGDMLFDVFPSGRSSLRNFTMENVTLIDSPSWTVSLNRVNGVRIENINMINWILNGDGVDLVCCENVLIKDCLFRCYDDCISLKVNHGNLPDCRNIEIEGCLIWEDIARGIVIGPEAGNAKLSPGRIHDVNIHDCVFLEHRGSSEGDNVRAALSICQWKHPLDSDGYATEISDISCRNLYFDAISTDGTYIYIWQMPGQTESSYIRNLKFENIYINDENNVLNPAFQAYTNGNHIIRMTIDNMVISDRKVTSESEDFVCEGNFTDLVI